MRFTASCAITPGSRRMRRPQPTSRSSSCRRTLDSSLIVELEPDAKGVTGAYRPSVLHRGPVVARAGSRQIEGALIDARGARGLQDRRVGRESAERIDADSNGGSTAFIQATRHRWIVVSRIGKARTGSSGYETDRLCGCNRHDAGPRRLRNADGRRVQRQVEPNVGCRNFRYGRGGERRWRNPYRQMLPGGLFDEVRSERPGLTCRSAVHEVVHVEVEDRSVQAHYGDQRSRAPREARENIAAGGYQQPLA